MQAGNKVNWQYQPRGGYDGYIVAGIIVPSHGRKKVRIAVYNLNAQEIMYRSVDPERLSPRTGESVLDEKFYQEGAK